LDGALVAGEVRIIILTAAHDMKDRQGRAAHGRQEWGKNVGEDPLSPRVVFNRSAPAGEFVGLTAIPGMHDDQRGVRWG
jgi:hypothetical protein